MSQNREDARHLIIARTKLAWWSADLHYFGSTERAALLCAIGACHIEGRPGDISSLAALASLSRKTAIRLLAQFKAEGRVTTSRQGRRVIVMLTDFNALQPATIGFLDRMEAIIRRAAADLSRLDKSKLEHGNDSATSDSGTSFLD